MPFHRTRLTRTEELDYLATAEELRSLGVAIEIPEEWRRVANFLDVSISPASTVYVLGSGTSLYALYVRLVSTRPNLILGSFDIATPWDSGVLCGLDDNYRFAPGLDINPKQVLNYRFDRGLRFRYVGDRVEGWILGTGLKPVPAEYGLGFPAPVELVLIGPAGLLCRTQIPMLVLRSPKSSKARLRKPSVSTFVESVSVAACDTSAEASSSFKHNSEAAEPDPRTRSGN